MPARTHGQSQRTKAYRTWANIKQRCLNKDNPRYKDYGGRGITLCEAWHDFAQFYKDVGEPTTGMTLDRRDNNKGYEPGNVRWRTVAEQNQNSRRCVMIEINGVSKPINVWLREYGTKYVTYKLRRRLGWSYIDAITLPISKIRREYVERKRSVGKVILMRN